MSLTIGGIIVMVAGTALVKFGFSESCSNEIVTLAPLAVGGVMSWIGRVRRGDITWFGAYKKSKLCATLALASIHPLAVCFAPRNRHLLSKQFIQD